MFTSRLSKITLLVKKSPSRQFCTKSNQETKSFDTKLLDVIACPLTKTPLRFDASKNELICDELGI